MRQKKRFTPVFSVSGVPPQVLFHGQWFATSFPGRCQHLVAREPRCHHASSAIWRWELFLEQQECRGRFRGARRGVGDTSFLFDGGRRGLEAGDGRADTTCIRPAPQANGGRDKGRGECRGEGWLPYRDRPFVEVVAGVLVTCAAILAILHMIYLLRY